MEKRKVAIIFTQLDYLILENLTTNLNFPNICDIKIGQKTFGEDASEEKIKIEIEKYPLQEKLGFRFSGMKIFDGKDWKIYDRKYGSKFTEETVKNGFIEYFTDKGVIRTDLIKKCISELEKLESLFETQKLYRFYSSSILIIYENETIIVRCIDFAHVFEIKDNGIDQSYLYGVKSLIQVIKSCIF